MNARSLVEKAEQLHTQICEPMQSDLEARRKEAREIQKIFHLLYPTISDASIRPFKLKWIQG
jgi:hypothetical protein